MGFKSSSGCDFSFPDCSALTMWICLFIVDLLMWNSFHWFVFVNVWLVCWSLFCLILLCPVNISDYCQTFLLSWFSEWATLIYFLSRGRIFIRPSVTLRVWDTHYGSAIFLFIEQAWHCTQKPLPSVHSVFRKILQFSAVHFLNLSQVSMPWTSYIKENLGASSCELVPFSNSCTCTNIMAYDAFSYWWLFEVDTSILLFIQDWRAFQCTIILAL